MTLTNSSYAKYVTLIGAGLGILIIGIDFTIVNTALPAIQRGLSISSYMLLWLIAGFGLTFSTFLVTMGRFSDLKGRKKLYHIGIIGFGLSSLGAGLSTAASLLITMRFLQGIFAAIVMPAGMAIVAHAFPKKQQGRALGFYFSLCGGGLAFGPVIGGLILSCLNWRWLFFINIPITIIVCILCQLSVTESKTNDLNKIDWLGTLFITTSVGGLILAVDAFGFYGWNYLVIGALIICAVTFLLLLMVETRVSVPLMPLGIFKNRGLLAGILLFCAGTAIAWSIIFIMPLYLQHVLRLSVMKSSTLLFVMTIMTIIAPIVAGHLYDKKSKQIVIQSGFLLSVIGLLLFTRFSADSALWYIIMAFFLFGTAWGVCNSLSTPLALSETQDAKDAGLFAGVMNTCGNVSAVIILTLFNTIFHASKNASFVSRLHTGTYFLLSITLFAWLGYLLLRRNRQTAT